MQMTGTYAAMRRSAVLRRSVLVKRGYVAGDYEWARVAGEESGLGRYYVHTSKRFREGGVVRFGPSVAQCFACGDYGIMIHRKGGKGAAAEA